MNKERILQVADAIEQHTIPWLGFNMGPFIYSAEGTAKAIAEKSPELEWSLDRSGHECGTVACIAGHAAIIMADLKAPLETEAQVDEFAQGSFIREASEWLGLEAGPAHKLFFGDGAETYRAHIPADQAVRTLRHLAATGQVDWTV